MTLVVVVGVVGVVRVSGFSGVGVGVSKVILLVYWTTVNGGGSL